MNAPFSPTAAAVAERHKAFHEKIARRAAELEAHRKPTKTIVRRRPRCPDPGPVNLPSPGRVAEDTSALLTALNAWREKTVLALESIDGEIEKLTCGVSIARIQHAVAREFGITRYDLCSDSRSLPIVRPRQIAFYLCRHLTKFSLPAIGRHFGDRDHTTILHGVNKIESLIKSDWLVAYDVAHIESLL